MILGTEPAHGKSDEVEKSIVTMKTNTDPGIRITTTEVENTDIVVSPKREVDATRMVIGAINDADRTPGRYRAQSHLKVDAGITDPVGNVKRLDLHPVLQTQHDPRHRS